MRSSGLDDEAADLVQDLELMIDLIKIMNLKEKY